ncbi:MAG: hypothetical protein A2156_12010 [Deltaproteobacteria bacterium RBG_16_48_10]|nr:MAG: hypothetical protein A2156_12010 [Deltaproteobacteria bacterium RBG_16_48_10]
MRKNTHRSIAILIRLLLIGFIILFPASKIKAEQSSTSVAPLNPDFLEFLNSREVNALQQSPDEHGLGLVPSPHDLSHLKGLSVFDEIQLLGLPTTFDLRSQGLLTPIRNQSSCGSCWSFATYGSLESNLLPLEAWDFSENNLKNTHGFDWGPCEGGNADMSIAYLARWSGPVNEADDPYNPASGTSPPGLSERKHVHEVLIIPDRANASDNDNIKQAVMAYGGLYTSMYWTSSYYNAAYKAYFYNGTGAKPSNHAIVIVGWDDNFDRNKFSPVPPGNGAFIVRNSWGTGFGENGYFYISYHDVRTGTVNYLFNNGEPTSNYRQIYQYDPLGWTSSIGYGSPTAWFANIFTASGTEQLKAVSFYTPSHNSTYELYIYRNVTSVPTSGSVAGSKAGTIASPGYHTVPLEIAVALTPGQDFSVVVRLTTPGYNYPIPVESPWLGYSSQATASAGESYISSNGTSWSDLTNNFSNSNVCLKAFASSLEERVGVFSNGYWSLDSNGNRAWDGCSTDLCLAFGLSIDLPVVGDWNNKGISKSGVFRNGNWFLDLNGNGILESPGDPMYIFGQAGDLPVTGDWNGTGMTKIGIFRNGLWALDLNGNRFWDAPPTDALFTFGQTLDHPVVGAW